MLTSCPCVRIHYYCTGESESLSRQVYRARRHDGHRVSVIFLAAGFGGLLSISAISSLERPHTSQDGCLEWQNKAVDLLILNRTVDFYLHWLGMQQFVSSTLPWRLQSCQNGQCPCVVESCYGNIFSVAPRFARVLCKTNLCHPTFQMSGFGVTLPWGKSRGFLTVV